MYVCNFVAKELFAIQFFKSAGSGDDFLMLAIDPTPGTGI